MKLLILHLSDMHFGDGTNYTKDNVNGIVCAMNPSMEDIQHILIIISGDLMYSGKKIQRKKIERFLTEFKQTIKKRYKIDIGWTMV